MSLSQYVGTTAAAVQKIKTKTAIFLSTFGLIAASGSALSLAIVGHTFAAAPAWKLNPTPIAMTCGGSPYAHKLNSVTENQFTGNFTGMGSYVPDSSYTWNTTGNVNGNALTFQIVYTGSNAGYTLNGVGTIANDGSVSGTLDNNCESFTMPAGAATAYAAPSQIIVTPGNTQGWITDDTRPGGAVNFVSDSTAPGSPHKGALQLTTDATTTSKAQYMHTANTPLSSVTQLSYSTKQVAASFAGGDASYQLPVCLGGVSGTTCNGFTTFVYEPYENGTVTPGVWQSWDVAAGQFWSSRTVTAGTCSVVAGGGGAPFYTLAALKAACPNAVVAGFGVNIGSNNPSYNVETDLVSFNNTTYNFEPTVTVTDEKDCKNGGWANSNTPTFANQNQCERWVEAEAEGNLRMSGPSQQIDFDVANELHEKNSVEYWNYDYPGGLHYKAKVVCTSINRQTKEARFMYQIPAGHPGLSGLYVVSYVKSVPGSAPDLYGHAATADQATATQWCQSGAGFTPTMYPVTKGKVHFE